MWLIILLIILFPLLAWGIVRALWLVRLRHIDADNETQHLPDEKRFMQMATIVLSALLLVCIPFLYQGYVEMRLKHQLMKMPLVRVLSHYRPRIYQSFEQDVRHAKARGADTQVIEQIWGQYLHELRIEWQKELPYSSLDSVIRYIRYRYSEADVLGKMSNDTCRNIDWNASNFAGITAAVEFMQRNAAFLEEIMVMTFASADERYRMNSLEQRSASQLYRHFVVQINPQFAAKFLTDIEDSGCAFQKAFYYALLDGNEREATRIMRWILLQKMVQANREERLHGK